MYQPPEFEYYILSRWDIPGEPHDFQIVSVVKDQNPLYGYGSWDLLSGPFDTWQEAENSAPI